MALWIPATLFAALMQALRFALQRHLKLTALSTAGATWARFVFAAPLALAVALGWAALSGQALPAPGAAFWGWIVPGALAQVLATMWVVALFARRAFPVGLTLAKTEVILSAGLGLVLLGDAVGPALGLAIGLGFLGVVALSDPPRGGARVPLRARLLNAASGYGLASGAEFAVSAVCYRGATLALESGDAVLRAGVALAAATAVQALALGLWLALAERGEIARVLGSWRVGALVGLTSMLGSLGWFTAFALQTAALVKALGQVEVLFTFALSVFWMGERAAAKEIAGAALILASIGIIFWRSLAP